MKDERKRPGRFLPDAGYVSWREIDGQVILLNKKERVFYELNHTGTAFWNAMLAHEYLDKIVAALAEDFASAGQDVLRCDAEEFFGHLLKSKFIRRVL